jgi:hypothetical protein
MGGWNVLEFGMRMDGKTGYELDGFHGKCVVARDSLSITIAQVTGWIVTLDLGLVFSCVTGKILYHVDETNRKYVIGLVCLVICYVCVLL